MEHYSKQNIETINFSKQNVEKEHIKARQNIENENFCQYFTGSYLNPNNTLQMCLLYLECSINGTVNPSVNSKVFYYI